jgi:YD repeat-containing protein
LDATYAAYIRASGTTLNLGLHSDGTLVETTNPKGEKSLSIVDGLGRTVRSIQIVNPTDITKNIVQSVEYDFMVAPAIVLPAAPGNLLETRQLRYPNGLTGSLQLMTRSQSDGVGRSLKSIDAENYVTSLGYDANGNRVSLRDPNGIGEDCIYDLRNNDTACTDTQAIPPPSSSTSKIMWSS